ncbi:3-hydroxyacyl-CoA dehydrogenase NAD-binding domain-containing protein [Gordonia terrae]|nr:3-hydroxyacyl-CoA dehydrogenase NAD-binding domain-containing protein [Gordonia terrae]
MNNPDVITVSKNDGIVTLTFDDPASSANTMTPAFRAALGRAVADLEVASDLRGVILTSAKRSFFAGGDLTALMNVNRESVMDLHREVTEIVSVLRRLEQLGKPVVAAINGAAIGGGLEIALAAHYRVALNGVKVGFPEVGLGLLPGGGGIVRTVRMLGLRPAVELILDGRTLNAIDARAVGLIDAVVDSTAALISAATAYIDAHPEAIQPWDARGHQIPGPDAERLGNVLAGSVHIRTKGAPIPAPRAIVAAAVEGSRVSFDTAQVIETRYFLSLATSRVAKNMIQGSFIDARSVAAGAGRPQVGDVKPVEVLAIVGAGMMGAGIAYQAARNGIQVRLKDVDAAAADRGKQYSRTRVAKEVQRGKLSEEQAEALLDRIAVVTDYSAFSGADALIEAVYEDPDLKTQTFREAEPHMAGALLATNTSTLPISELATGVERRADFIGMHFFSPVDKMPLLEIVVGSESSPRTVARAFDLGVALGKTNIIVNDKRGFFTSRVITKFTDEALAMLGEGISAASIEQAGVQAGYPVPPLQLSDELTITLPHKVRAEAKAAALAAGEEWVVHPAEPVMTRMIEEFGRFGRSTGGAFYDFVDGHRTGLWTGLEEHFRRPGYKIPFIDIVERMLFAEAIEALRTFDEGVMTSVPDANVGSLLGIGFPSWTGGVITFANGYEGGFKGFVARAAELAESYGARFEVPSAIVERSIDSNRFATSLT